MTPGPLGPKKGPYGPSVGRFLATRPEFGPKIRFCYNTPDFFNGSFVTLDDIFDLAPSDRFLVAVRPLGEPFSGHRAGFWPENPFFCYRTPDFVNGPFLVLDNIFDFSWPLGRSAGRFPATGPDFGPKIRILL